MSATTVAKPRARWEFVGSPIFAPLVTQLLIWVVFWFAVPHFGTVRTLSGIVGAASINAVVVVGVTMLMICGEFDLSVGSMIALGGFVFADVLRAGASPIVALLAALAVTAGAGAINGFLTVSTGIPSFIVTLGTRAVFRGAVWIYSGGVMRQFIKRMPVQDVLNGRLDVVNSLFTQANFRTGTLWALALGIIFQIILTRSAFGNQVFAVGGNPGAALTQGVNIKWVKLACFIITGALAGLAGVLTFSEFSTVLVVTGANVELSVIAAAVIGGTLLTGGAGSIIGGLLGILLISLLRSGVVLLGLPSDNYEAIVGVTIIGAALLNDWIVRRSVAVS